MIKKPEYHGNRAGIANLENSERRVFQLRGYFGFSAEGWGYFKIPPPPPISVAWNRVTENMGEKSSYRVSEKCLDGTAKIVSSATAMRELSIWWRYPQCRPGINLTLCS